jgi:translation elongation factor P/translation initiation factor 5A
MNKIGNHRVALSALLAILPLAAARPAEPPSPVKVEDAIHVTTKIEAVNLEKRTITVKDKDGKPVELEVSPEVRNLPQVKAGDTMNIVYYQSLGAEFKKPGEGVKGVQQDAVAGRAAEGERPSAGAGQQTRATVKIDSVDAATNTVKFTGPKGVQRTVAVKDPKAQAFIKQLKPGDEVELTYTEALAISVDPTKK